MIGIPNGVARRAATGRLLAALPAVAFLAACVSSPDPRSRSVSAPPPAVLEPDAMRFEKLVLLEGLDRPMELEVLPDGRVLLIEISGNLLIWDPRAEKPIVAGKLDVFTDMENGLLGLARDPNFAENGWLYLFHSPPDGPPRNLVSRFVLRGDKLDMASRVDVLEIPTQRDQCCHQAGALEFGPDGTLYISVGDNTNPFESDGFSPSDYRAGRSPWDAAKSSGNTNDLRGKILRIRPEPDGTYSIPEGNLFPPDDPESRPEIYVMGCRNPFRISVDPATGWLYWGEVGPDSGQDSDRGPRGYDEINQARAAGNFGWPYLIADNKAYAAYDFEAKAIGDRFDPAGPANLSPNNTGRETLPAGNSAFIWYPYGESAEFPVVGTGGRTACAGPVYHYSPVPGSEVLLPAKYDRCLFIYDWERGWIKAVKLDDAGDIAWIEDFMPDHKFLRPVDMQFGPQGDLYLLEYGSTWGKNEDSKLVRLQYRAGNRPPRPVAKAEPAVGRHPLEVAFSSEGTTDKDGDPLKFRWRFGDGWFGTDLFAPTSREANPTRTFRRPGRKIVELTATDAMGAAERTTVEVLVGNDPPTLTIESPAPGSFFDPGEPLPYKLFMEDAEDGDTFMVDMLGAEVFLTATRSAAPPERGPDGLWKAEEPEGLRLMKRTNCFNCHAADKKVVGPSFREISERYRDDKPGMREVLIGRVIDGAVGQWGEEPMLPHKDHDREDVGKMVDWVLARAEAGGDSAVFAGVEGSVPTTAEGPAGKLAEGFLLLTATYTDRGAKGAERLEGRTQALLRSRRVGAEHFDEQNGVAVLDAGDIDGGKAIGTITEGDWILYRGLDLSGVGSLRFRVASAGRGGAIEARLDAPDGPLLASVAVPVTGSWTKWRNVEAKIASAPDPAARDVFFVFVNPGGEKEGLFNVNWIEFRPAE